MQEGQHTSRQEVGNDVILHCSSDREVHLCRWKTPYLNTYIVGEGIYVERGRIQWLGKDPNFDCTIRYDFGILILSYEAELGKKTCNLKE